MLNKSQSIVYISQDSSTIQICNTEKKKQNYKIVRQ